MKNNKLIILIVVGILLATGITIFTLTRNKVKALSTGIECDCGGELTIFDYANNTHHYLRCGTCNKAYTLGHDYYGNTASVQKWVYIGNGKHAAQCIVCKYIDPNFSYDCTVESWTSNQGAGHYGECKWCKETFTEEHDYQYKSLGNGKHKVTCSGCNYSASEDCFGKNGFCNECGASMSSVINHTHTWGWTPDSRADSVNHALYCTDPTCPSPREDNSTPHVDEDENGLCDQSGCNDYHRNPETGSAWHKLDEDKVYYKAQTNSSGIVVCAMYCGDCHYNLEDRPHDWSNHDGVCANLCGYLCTKHIDMTRGTCSTCGYVVSCKHEAGTLYYACDGYHWSICKKCGDPIDATKEKCSFGFVKGLSTYNNKKHVLYCTECKDVDNYISKEHTYGNTVIKDELPTCTEEGSGKLYCEDECGYYKTVTLDALGHIDENNDGICDRKDCKEELCDHEDGEYKYNDTKHWWACDDCSYEESKESHDQKLSNNSYEPTCTEKGKYIYQCRDCDWEKEVTVDPLGHSLSKATCTEPAKCQRKGCTYTEGTALGHADENKDGKCDRCGYTMSIAEPECTHSNKEWKSDEDKHWQVCKECGEEISGTRENHTYENGKCECGKVCSHKNTTPKSDDTHHWDECQVCGEELNKEEHSYTNGECECGKEEDKKEDDNKNDDNKDDDNKDDDNKDDDNKDDNNKPDDNKNDENKDDDNNKDDENKDEENKEECKHTNKEWKCDSNEHWQVCKDCGEEIEGTRGKHVHVDGKCKNCGLKDSTSSNNTLPNTGIEENMQIAVMITLAILGSALLIKLSRED